MLISFADDIIARYPIYISKTNYSSEIDFFYWDENYHGADCVEWFFVRNDRAGEKCIAVLFDDKLLIMHTCHTDAFIKAIQCQICCQPFVWNADHTNNAKINTLEINSYFFILKKRSVNISNNLIRFNVGP